MVRTPFVRALLVAWLAVPAGCGRGEGGLPGAEAGSMAREQEASSLGAAGSRAESPSRQHEATSPIADPREAPQDTGSPEAAVAVIRTYYAAISAGHYARAYRYWSGGGAASGQTFEEFRRGFAGTASVRVEVGEPGRIEGAAGSRYIRIPVEVHATTTDGAAQCFRGGYTLRRAVVPGATEEMRRWRISSAELTECGA